MQLPALMKPARIDRVRADHLPNLPAWWPVPKTDDGTAPQTPEERARERRARAVTEARQGPVDGRRYAVTLSGSGAPPDRFTPSGTPGLWYTLDREESTRTHLVYRYDPECPAHRKLMAAVEAGFAEVGMEYTITAREEDHAEHTAPRLAYPRG